MSFYNKNTAYIFNLREAILSIRFCAAFFLTLSIVAIPSLNLKYANAQSIIISENGDGDMGISSLMNSAMNNDLIAVKFFSKAGTEIVNQKNIGGATALHMASRVGNEQIAKVLIENGADVNSTDNEGWTPLMRASLGGNSNLVKTLLNSGSEIKKLNSLQETAIVHASTSQCEECLKHIFQNYEDTQDIDFDILKEQILESVTIVKNKNNTNLELFLESHLETIENRKFVSKLPDFQRITKDDIEKEFDLGKNKEIIELPTQEIIEEEIKILDSKIPLNKDKKLYTIQVEEKEELVSSFLEKEKIPVAKVPMKKHIKQFIFFGSSGQIVKSTPIINKAISTDKVYFNKKFIFFGSKRQSQKNLDIKKARLKAAYNKIIEQNNRQLEPVEKEVKTNYPSQYMFLGKKKNLIKQTLGSHVAKSKIKIPVFRTNIKNQKESKELQNKKIIKAFKVSIKNQKEKTSLQSAKIPMAFKVNVRNKEIKENIPTMFKINIKSQKEIEALRKAITPQTFKANIKKNGSKKDKKNFIFNNIKQDLEAHIKNEKRTTTKFNFKNTNSNGTLLLSK